MCTKQNEPSTATPPLPTPKSGFPSDPPLSVCAAIINLTVTLESSLEPSSPCPSPTNHQVCNSVSLVLLSCCPSSLSPLSLCYFRLSEHLYWTIVIASNYFLFLLFPLLSNSLGAQGNLSKFQLWLATPLLKICSPVPTEQTFKSLYKQATAHIGKLMSPLSFPPQEPWVPT